MSDHGNCPHCGANWNGDSIWETGLMFAHGKGLMGSLAEAEADRYASMYGASRTKGRWGRQVGIYDMWKDRTVEWECPDCGQRTK